MSPEQKKVKNWVKENISFLTRSIETDLRHSVSDILYKYLLGGNRAVYEKHRQQSRPLLGLVYEAFKDTVWANGDVIDPDKAPKDVYLSIYNYLYGEHSVFNLVYIRANETLGQDLNVLIESCLDEKENEFNMEMKQNGCLYDIAELYCFQWLKEIMHPETVF